MVKPPEASAADESAVSVAVRGWLLCERAWASIRTEFAGQVGSAGATLLLATAVPFPTLAPGTLKFTWFTVVAPLPICRMRRPGPFAMETVAARAAATASARQRRTSAGLFIRSARPGEARRPGARAARPSSFGAGELRYGMEAVYVTRPPFALVPYVPAEGMVEFTYEYVHTAVRLVTLPA